VEEVALVEAEVAGYQFEKLFVLDYDRSNLENRNVIFPFDKLFNFIDANFVCKQCGNSKST
jgi:rubredoxin